MTRLPKIRVATDSMADIPPALAEQLGIVVVPATITFGDQTYLEGVNLAREDFYDRLIKYAGLPKTASPGPGAFADAYGQLIRQHHDAGVPLEAIISFHPPMSLSGLYNSAYAASQMVEGPKIVVVDSGQISMGIGWLAICAARAAWEGKSLDEVLSLIAELKPRIQVVAGLDTLEWAARSGRVNRLVAALGNLLAVKPILKVEKGEITLAERVRTHSRQIERVLEMGRALAPFRDVAIMHARAPQLAEELADRLADIHPRQRIIVAEIGCILGSYTGPGAYGIIAVRQ